MQHSPAVAARSWFSPVRPLARLTAAIRRLVAHKPKPPTSKTTTTLPFALRAIVDLVDFERLRAPDAPRRYVSATDVETGRAFVFDNRDREIDGLRDCETIEPADSGEDYAASSKLHSDWNFIEHRYELGRDAATSWIAAPP